MALAGENRQELEHVLWHYKDDSLKLAAARFLIENMPYHFYEEEFYALPGDGRHRPQLTDFSTEEAGKAHLDSLARAGRMGGTPPLQGYPHAGQCFPGTEHRPRFRGVDEALGEAGAFCCLLPVYTAVPHQP